MDEGELMILFGFLCSLVWLVSVLLFLSGTYFSCASLKRAGMRKKQQQSTGPISILKPVCGLEEGLERNLLSFFQLEYASYELIFTIAHPEDPARSIIEKLMQRFPNIQSRLHIMESKVGKNPKINNIYLGYKTTQYSLVLISDSNIRVPRNYLSEMVGLLEPGVGVVTSTISGVGATTFGATLESIYLNTYLCRWIHLSNKLGNAIVLGKSMLFRKSDLESCGDIDALANVIAEDYATSAFMRKKGLKVAVMNAPVNQYLGAFSFKAFWLRHIRWGRIRKCCEYPLFLAEPFASALGAGVCGALAFWAWTGGAFWLFLLTHLSVWFLIEFFLATRQESTRSWKVLPYWLALEVVTVPIWISAFFGNTILWRGNRLRLYAGGRL